jgi:hypothetical protein
VLLNGRFAGRKAIVVKNYDEGHGDRKFPHAIGKKLSIRLELLKKYLLSVYDE